MIDLYRVLGVTLLRSTVEKWLYSRRGCYMLRLCH